MANYEHFIQSKGLKFAGFHLIIDMSGLTCPENALYVHSIFIDAVKLAGATLLHDHYHTFPSNDGLSGTVVLAESHATYHTWWEANKSIACDFFMCGEANPFKVLQLLKERFNPQITVFNIAIRIPVTNDHLVTSRKYYVYTLNDPVTKECFYVGKGSGLRIKRTVSLAVKCNSAKAAKLKELKLNGLKPAVHIVSNNLNEELALLIESELITFYGKQNNGGTLTNIIDLGSLSSLKATEGIRRYYTTVYAQSEYQRAFKEAYIKRDTSFLSSESYKQKQSKAHSKEYIITYLDNSQEHVVNLKSFAQKHGYDASQLCGLATGRRTTPYRGMRCRYKNSQTS